MTEAWIIGTVISISFAVIGWLFVRNKQHTDRAIEMAEAAKVKASEAQTCADRTGLLLQEHVKHADRRFDDLEKHEKERHDNIIRALDELKDEVSGLRNGFTSRSRKH